MAWQRPPLLAGFALLLVLSTISDVLGQPQTCPAACKQQCAKVCDQPFNYKCAPEPWKHMEVCGWDGRRYTNECCALCAGTYVRAYCSVPLALATPPNTNPKLCTQYC